MISAEHLKWDSEFFGFKVGALKISAEDEVHLLSAINALYLSETKLVYVFADKALDSESILKSHNGKKVDEKVIFKKSLNNTATENTNEICVFKNDYVTDELKDLAFQSGEFSRFRIDKRLPAQTFERLYTIWIEKSVNGQFADKVFVFELDGFLAGFVTVKIKPGYGEIGLIAVNSAFRGKQIGSKLLSHAEDFVRRQNKHVIKVPTQMDNLQACNFYGKNGYEIDSISHIYHFINL